MTTTSAKVETLRVSDGEADMRLDRWFRVHFPEVGYTYLQKLLRSGQIRIDSKRAQANDRLSAGSEIRVPAIVRQPKKSGNRIAGAARRLEGRPRHHREDDHLRGRARARPQQAVRPGRAGRHRHEETHRRHARRHEPTASAANARASSIASTAIRPACCSSRKRATPQRKLGRTFQTRSAAKTYWALVKGVPKPPQGKIEAALVKASGPDGDKVRKAQPGEQDRAMHATTHYSVIDRAAHKASWVSLKPVTGRQHQLRAHMHLIGHPIVGDNKYEGDVNMPAENMEKKLHLHARRLVIPHPKTRPADRRHRAAAAAHGGDVGASRFRHREVRLSRQTSASPH